MVDAEPDNLVLRYVRGIDQKLDRMSERLDDLTAQTRATESAFAAAVAQVTTLHARIDRIDVRLDRIERRLGLIEIAPPAI
jgi:hypothetical protein